MLLDLVKRFFGLKRDSLSVNKSIIKSSRQISKTNINYSTPVLNLDNSNVVNSQLKEQQEIEDLYAEIRVLQAKNREKINKNKIRYSISK